MTLPTLLTQLSEAPEQVSFDEVINTIAENYQYTPSTFSNGSVVNDAGTNEGSCKIFAFAKLHKLSKEQTLACFGKYYREDVLKHPEGNDHGNIRNFMISGWEGIVFSGDALLKI
ncbi:HopJ type III effector protein [Pseudocolwellia agarivorans]|uniref:HopJ type III effector protein n=1 Tax=Pseudocolwellia agarivorans TaxID=1911682 RepID=UPI000986A467|nr:HopJ type III effector protein [Pseudocolwellia agarivorans]